MERLKNYIYTTKLGSYESERIKVDKGIYDYKIFSDQEIIGEEKDVLAKTGRELEKYIRTVIKDYEKDLEDEKEALADLKEEEAELDEELAELEETTKLEDMQEAIKEVLAEEDLKEEEIEEVKENLEEAIKEVLEEEEIEVKEDLEDVIQKIDAVFVKCKSPIEMQELFEIIDTKIRKIDGVNFKATTSDLVYQVSGMNFLRIRPKTNKLNILHAPDYYKNIVNLTDEKEIDEVMVSIKESCEYIKEKRNKK